MSLQISSAIQLAAQESSWSRGDVYEGRESHPDSCFKL